MTEPSKEAMDIWRKAYDMAASCADGQFIDAAAAHIIALQAEVARLQRILDSRPAINAALPESYVKWSQQIYTVEALAAIKGRTHD